MAASTSPFMWTGYVKPQSSYFGNSHHRYRYGCCKVNKLRSWKSCSDQVTNSKRAPVVIASLVDPDGAIMPDWVSGSDQLLLMASICLTYMAGVVPVPKNNFAPRIENEDNVVGQSLGPSSGSARKNGDSANLGYAWDSVKNKILDTLHAVEQRSNFRNDVLEFEERHTKQPMSLSAVPDGPKLRLLWISFQRIYNEVNGVIGDFETGNVDNWSKACAEIIQKSFYPVCMSWLTEELRLENKKSDEGLISSMVERLREDDTVLQNVRKSGKEDLYAELLYFLKFGSLRKSSCYDESMLLLHGDSILEDLVISFADGIASVYLELISVDGNLSNEMNRLGMTMCDLSTRALQRLRNEVALNQWLYQNLEAVVSMYEDRFDLCSLQLKVIEQTSENRTEIRSWWKKITLREPIAVQPALCYAVINQFSLPVKRTKELRALTGWRYYFSLYLELSDISMPLIRALIDKVSRAISFFLVTLIGRSLGLIYTGIRQSLRWK